MRGSLSNLVAAILIAALVAVTGCFPVPRESDDASHAAFIHAAYPVLLGERPSGINEVEVLADISQLMGKEAVVRMLMNDRRFTEHWANILVDELHIQREYSNTIPAQDGSCWGKPTRPLDRSIALWVSRKGPALALNPSDGAPARNWNMADLVQSAIAIDDLSVIYRANLFPLSTRRYGTGDGDKRDVLTEQVLRVYLNRDLECLRCHNPTYSVSNRTDANNKVTWRRLWAIPGHPEKNLFGNYYSELATLSRLQPVMRADIRHKPQDLTKVQPEHLPWGMHTDCVKETNDVSLKNKGMLLNAGFLKSPSGSDQYPSAMFGSIAGVQEPKASVRDLESALHRGIIDLRQGYTRLEARPTLTAAEEQYCKVVQIVNSNCVGCHSGDKPEGQLDLSGYDLAGTLIGKGLLTPGSLNSTLWQRLIHADRNLSPMPPTFRLSTQNMDAIKAWIVAGAPRTASTAACTVSHVPDVTPDKAFAFLTAANTVDGIWNAVMGSRLTISHGYPRNAYQRDMLWNLTEFEFIKKGWSLKAVLIKILTSDWFGRANPGASQASNAYNLPAILDPWTVGDPDLATSYTNDQRYNGFGALIHRHRVDTILNSTAKALGWRRPSRFPEFAPAVGRPKIKYPDVVNREIGQFLSPKTPGFEDVNFQSLLAFEAEVGLCDKQGRSAGGSTDWIDELIAATYRYNQNVSGVAATYADVWIALKDRLLQDPTIGSTATLGTTRQGLIMALFGITPPTATTINDPYVVNEAALRRACGTLLKSPQFLLAMATPQSYANNSLPPPPRIQACLPGEACGYAAQCSYWTGHLSAMGYAIGCRTRSVYQKPVSLQPGPALSPTPTPGPVLPPPTLPLEPLVDGPAPPGGTLPAPRPEELPELIIPIDGPITIDPGLTPDSPGHTIDIDWLTELARRVPVRQRIDQLCPAGLCGFLQTVETGACLSQPSQETCFPLLPSCDPRTADHQASVNLCNRSQADVRAPGVLVAWLEGEQAEASSDVQWMQAGEWGWQPLPGNVTLQAGDLIHVPLDAWFRTANGIIDVDALGFAAAGDIKGHILAVTGPSIRQALGQIRPPEPDAMDPNAFIFGVGVGRYESRGVTAADWATIVGYEPRIGSEPTLDIEAILERHRDYAKDHLGLGEDLADGEDTP